MAREDADDISYFVDGTGPDGQQQWGIDDLRKTVKMTLADYLHCITSEAPDANAYEVPSGYEEGSYRKADGSPADIQTGGPYADSAFSTDPELDTWSNPFLDALAKDLRVSSYLQKGDNGHELLKDIKGEDINRSGKSTAEDGDSPVEKQISQVLRSNRFNPTPGRTPYVQGDTPHDPVKSIPTEGSLGAFRDPTTGEILSTDVSVDTMRKVALSMMLRATGDDRDGTLDPDSANPLAPSSVQLGSTRINPEELRAQRAFEVNNLSRVTLDSDTPQIHDDDFYSYGNLNSFLEPFDGFLPLGMISLAAASTVAAIVSAQVIFGLVGAIINNDASRLDPGPYIVGQHGKPKPVGLLGTLARSPRTLGFITTENDFGDAAARGAAVFFGFTGDDLGNAAQESLLNVLSAPGYYAVTTRAIIRNLDTLANSIRDVDFTNPVEGAQAVLGMVDVIRSSKVLSFFNIIAGLGDIALNMEGLGFPVVPGKRQSNSIQNKLPDNGASRVMKSRAADGPSALSLSWRNSATPSAYILPASLVNAGGDFGAGTQQVEQAVGSLLARDMEPTRERRLSAAKVRDIENKLECEYVPFYFHDLRTNEITSFHAFLASLDDSYSANYDTTDAYGRIDPVFTYKNTQRSIGLSFHVAATSREDFDVMWWKINKLTSLLYPQWSRGRLVENSDGVSFYQPFSQIPTASPMIRMRIGDVIKSNYSKFGLARMFGLGTDDFKPSSSFTSTDLFDKININRLRAEVERMTLDPDLNPGMGFEAGDRAFLRPTTVGYYAEADPVSPGFGSALATNILGRGTVRNRLRTRQEYEVEVVLVTQQSIDTSATPISISQKTSYQVKFVNEGPPGFSDKQVLVSHADLRVNPRFIAINKAGLNVGENEELDTVSEVQEFLSLENNPIAKAFDSAKGRGLAGVITSMKFDWYEPTWEIDPGARAPKWCKVEMDFSPIHDIPPGLDADGFNRAPLYPVGAIERMVGDIHDDDIREIVRECLSEVESVISSNGI